MDGNAGQIVRIAVVGTGGMGTDAHVAAYHESPYARVVALCDVNPENLTAAATKYSVAATYADYHDLFARESIDAVDVSTPNVSHAEISLAAIRCGYHVLCEKPLAMNRHEAREMAGAARTAGVQTAVNFTYRHVPAAKFIREIILSGEIGEIYHIVASYNQGWLVDPATPRFWRLRQKLSGTGVLGDLGSHLIDLARFWTAEFSAVSGHLKTFVNERPLPGGEGTGVVDVDDAASFLAEFASGATGSFFCTRNAFARSNTQRAEIYGTRGGLIYDNEQPNEIQFAMGSLMGRQRRYSVMPVPRAMVEGRSTTMHDFVADLARGTAKCPTFDDGAVCQEVLDAVEESARRRTWVKVPVEAESGLSSAQSP
ncbi:MAG TPA: Gfo/Idh/MocA family oxidoreductase [Chloroflexota bacterium]|nr:Gfo/Idh/MocA family oxidoreductase [Chloroflexota bacterium]